MQEVILFGLLRLLTSKAFPLGANGRLYSPWVRSVMLYITKTKKTNRHNGSMIRWMCNVGPEKRLPAMELRIKLHLTNMRESAYKIERVPDLVKVEISRLVLV